MILPKNHTTLSTTLTRLARALCIALLIALFIPVQATANTNDYQLGAGDEIRIQVYQEADLSMVLRLDESGTFDYPYIGTITAKKRSLEQLKQTITEGLLQDVLVDHQTGSKPGRRRHRVGIIVQIRNSKGRQRFG